MHLVIGKITTVRLSFDIIDVRSLVFMARGVQKIEATLQLEINDE